MKSVRVKCKVCGYRFTAWRLERERISAYCDTCRAEREREHARERMAAMRRRRGGA